MHQFLSKYKVECPLQAWEMNARTILSIIRLHAAREMLRISPPDPKKFLIFALYDELPKGDYVLEELAESLKKVNCGHPCSASSILRSMNLSIAACSEVKEEKEQKEHKPISNDSSSPLQTAINQTREEAKEIEIAKSTTDGLKGEGISDSIAVLLELLKPLKSVLRWIQEVFLWERPVTTLTVLAATLIIVYKEWFGLAIAACLLTTVAKMIQARKKRLPEKCDEIVVCTASDQSTVESIVSAQYGLITIHEILQAANITIMKIWSILISKAHKHADMVMLAMAGLAIVLAVTPFKYILMGGVLYGFIMSSKPMKNLQRNESTDEQGGIGNRRLKEWWESIPIIPVRVEDKPRDSPKKE